MVRQIPTSAFVRSVSLDPEGSYVAASMADGNLGVWSLGDGSMEVKRHVCPKVGCRSSCVGDRPSTYARTEE